MNGELRNFLKSFFSHITSVFFILALSCPACFEFNPEDLQGFDATTDEVVAPDGIDVDGDGFELGEPSDDGGTEPDPDVAEECEGDDSECDDENECTVDTCVSNRCVFTVVADGEACSGGVCCGGQCVGCCEDSDCDDDNPCTDDRCAAHACQRTSLPDLTECDGGICCSGQHYLGGTCCGDEDCDDGCLGAATACSGFDESACEAQTGCALVTNCWGDPSPCESHVVRASCEACGCEYYLSACHGDTPPACSTFLSSGACTDCGCAWEPRCTGAHRPCTTYLDRSECNSQDGCHWSTCVDHACT